MDKPETNFESVQTDNVLRLHIKDKASLYAAYMPFLKNGGLFVETTENRNLGEAASLLLSLLEEPEKISILGKVAWVTPASAQHNWVRGLGITFNEKDSISLRRKIESYLADYAPEQKRTHTL